MSRNLLENGPSLWAAVGVRVQSFTSLSPPIVRGAAGGCTPARPGVTAIFFEFARLEFHPKI
jgi:hypothetical protein